MDELIEKVEKFKIAMDNSDSVIRIKQLNKELKDPLFLALINDFKQSRNLEVKKEIFNNKSYVEYKNLENEINLLILKINQELKKISSKGKCFK